MLEIDNGVHDKAGEEGVERHVMQNTETVSQLATFSNNLVLEMQVVSLQD